MENLRHGKMENLRHGNMENLRHGKMVREDGKLSESKSARSMRRKRAREAERRKAEAEAMLREKGLSMEMVSEVVGKIDEEHYARKSFDGEGHSIYKRSGYKIVSERRRGNSERFKRALERAKEEYKDATRREDWRRRREGAMDKKSSLYHYILSEICKEEERWCPN